MIPISRPRANIIGEQPRERKNFVFITIGEGVGAGIFVNGSIYRGSQWTAGEIGYLRVPNISREHPTIHNYGKIEKLLGAPGILKSWQANRATIPHTSQGEVRS